MPSTADPVSSSQSESDATFENEKSAAAGAPVHLESAPEESRLSDAHREYLLARHGRLDLNPLPSMSPDDPLNWPAWKKNTQALMVAFHSMIATFMAAGIVPAYDDFAKDYATDIHQSAYLTSIQIAVLGVAPFFWNPVAARFGRRPVFLVSVFGSMVCNIGGANCTSFASQIVTRALTAVCISPPIGIGSGVITELFFSDERAKKMGWWTLLLTLGVPSGPFFMGFVTKHAGYIWIFWIFTIVNFCQLVAYLVFGAETLFPREAVMNGETPPKSSLIPRRIDPTPFNFGDIIRPLTLGRYVDVVIPALSYAIVFCYANIVIVVEMPSVFGKRYDLDPQQVGLLFISIIIGSVIGEQSAAPLTGLFLKKYEAWTGKKNPANRLWSSYVGFLTVVVGILVWGIRIQQAKTFNVTPLVGAAIASFGNQVITTALISFAVECHRERSSDVGVFINVFRQEIGFVGPFYFPYMFETLNFAGSAGLMCGLIAVFSLLPVVILQFVRTRAA
ncbi:hypothetical protein AJ79_07966 [Helicocarpus griseus UAMH5409]|uniref:Major facilitator superfamily (MFS) profile domain-containing protein n=1 Tax=Helicocarpus griseus UAMH5409 TaxID=1447875 RepID=A0A2B7WPC8_9EURO|nr:hypothetical protein AJ79_07966 [Helicocarpus griseus UAMH5409]